MSDPERSARVVSPDSDSAAEQVPAEQLDPFEKALRARPEIMERLEAVIGNPSKAVPSRHHPPPGNQ